MGQCQDVDIPRFVECLGSFQYLDATAQMAEMGSRPADPQRAPFLPFRLAFRVPESGRSGQGVSSVKKGVDSGMAGVGTMNENGTVPRKDI